MTKQNAPVLSSEQRAEALAKAMRVRADRAAMRVDLKSGQLPVVEALEEPVAQRMPVRQFLVSCPGIGPALAARFIDANSIPANRRVAGLGPVQRRLLVEFAATHGDRSEE